MSDNDNKVADFDSGGYNSKALKNLFKDFDIAYRQWEKRKGINHSEIAKRYYRRKATSRLKKGT